MGGGTFVVTEDFYPRPPRGGRRVNMGDSYATRSISIHALREEGDGRFDPL